MDTTELAAIEAVSALLDNAMTSFTVFFSFTFAYLTVCYLVGASLTRFQAAAVSILYIFSACSTGLTTIGMQRGIGAIQASNPSTAIDETIIFDISFWHTSASILFTAIILLSLFFMYDCRRRGGINNESAI